MIGFETSYVGLFQKIDAIEIPNFQRDYAQGRTDERTARIRDRFLSELIAAITAGTELSLDFVYGDLKGDNLFIPLDGQQRLTTLFLLHWYVGVRSGRLHGDERWLNLTYDTRPASRTFCQQLARHICPDLTADTPSGWLTDQNWFSLAWKQDPTISSMLVVLDDIHRKLAGKHIEHAWERLTDLTSMAIKFHVLPIQELGLDDDIYINMNSRGRPLTDFELFKARFERILRECAVSEVRELAKDFEENIDGKWMNLFWQWGRKAEDVDSAILRYMQYLTDLAGWLDGKTAHDVPDLEQQCLDIYAREEDGQSALAHLKLLFHGLNAWLNFDDAKVWFEKHFVPASKSDLSAEAMLTWLPLFNARDQNTCNLFRECCEGYREATRRFGLAEALQLYAVLVHRSEHTQCFDRRMRVVRNLIERSRGNEVRADGMPVLIQEVGRVIRSGDIGSFHGFNDNLQGDDERRKRNFLDAHLNLLRMVFELEDHELLQGCLVAFELDAETFERRAQTFIELFSDRAVWGQITGALLAAGDYYVRIGAKYQFGSASQPEAWKAVFTARNPEERSRVRKALALLLDYISERENQPLAEALNTYINDYWQRREQEKQCDWRYYFVKYSVMRDLESRGFAVSPGSSGEAEGLHVISILTIGNEYREDVAFGGIQQKFRQALA